MGWACTTCTYFNTGSREKGCSMCESAAVPELVVPNKPARASKKARVIEDSDEDDDEVRIDVDVEEEIIDEAAEQSHLLHAKVPKAQGLGDEPVRIAQRVHNVAFQRRIFDGQQAGTSVMGVLSGAANSQAHASSLSGLSGAAAALRFGALTGGAQNANMHARQKTVKLATIEQAPVPFNVGGGAGWLEKHSPHSLAEVALAAKKLEEASKWLQSALRGRAELTARRALAGHTRRFGAAAPKRLLAQSQVESTTLPPNSSSTAFDDWDIDDADLDAAITQIEQRHATSMGITGAGLPQLTVSAQPPHSSLPLFPTLLTASISAAPPPPPAITPRLLILAGPPGIGKSTAVHLLCKELRVRLNVWNEADAKAGRPYSSTLPAWLAGAYRANGSGYGDGDDEGGDGGLNRVLGEVYLNARADFDSDDRAFRVAGPAGQRKGGSIRSAMESTLEPFAAFLSSDSLPRSRLHTDYGVRLRRGPLQAGIRGEGASGSSNSFTSQNDDRVASMIEEIPRLGGGGDRSRANEWRKVVTDIFLRHLNAAAAGPPVILVMSEGIEPGEPVCRPSLMRLLGAAVLDHPATTLLEVGRVPDGRMMKAVRAVAAAERLPAAIHFSQGKSSTGPANGSADADELSIDEEQGVPLEEVLATVVSSAGGDLRHAIMTLQMLAEQTAAGRAINAQSLHGPTSHAGAKRKAVKGTLRPAVKRKARDIDADAGDSAVLVGKAGAVPLATVRTALRACGRDDFFDVLHIFGKLLYGKRHATGELENDPDTLAGGCAYDATAITCFLFDNAPGFFTDVGDLSRTLDAYSICDVLLGCEDRGSSVHGRMGAFPEAHASAVAARAVSSYNAHPAPSTFKPIHKPVLYGVERVRTSNKRWLTEECLGMSCDVGMEAVNTYGGWLGGVRMTSPHERATAVIPMLGIMLSASRAHPVSRTAGGVGSSSSSLPWHIQERISLRAEALIVAVCTYGNAMKVRSGEVMSTIGGPVGAALLQAMSDASRGVEDEYGAEDAGLRLDEEQEQEANGNSAIRQAATIEPLLGTQHVSTAGLLAGMWDTYAASRGVDVHASSTQWPHRQSEQEEAWRGKSSLISSTTQNLGAEGAQREEEDEIIEE